MKTKLQTLSIFGIAFITLTFAGCSKSDKEYEQALVGNWQTTKCPFYTIDDHDRFWFYGGISFGLGQTMTESVPWAFCKDSCEIPASDPMEFCTCEYYVDDGHLIILPNADNPRGHYSLQGDFPYNNPVVDHIVEKLEDYLYSSARNYAELDNLLEITLAHEILWA